MPPAVESQSLNTWTTREVPRLMFNVRQKEQNVTLAHAKLLWTRGVSLCHIEKTSYTKK